MLYNSEVVITGSAVMYTENSSWVVHLSEFVLQKLLAIASDFCGIQTHRGELRSAQVAVPMIDSISSTMFFHVIA